MDTVTQPGGLPERRLERTRVFRTQERPHWHAAGALVLAVFLYLRLPERLTIGPNWYLLVPEILLFPPLLITTDVKRRHGSRWRRLLFFALSDQSRFQRAGILCLVGVTNAANLGSLVLLSDSILNGKITSGTELVLSGMQVWLTNVIVFALWYWELDRGGPASRTLHPHRSPDFLFPQEATPAAAPHNWRPGFVDYLYVAYTNATAFSPTDTMPLTGWAKVLMSVQAFASLVTGVLVVARAVNILH